MKRRFHIPGLAGVFGPDAGPAAWTRKALEPLFRGPCEELADRVELTLESPLGIVGLLRRDGLDHRSSIGVAGDVQYQAIWEGEFFLPQGPRGDGAWLLETLNRYGLKGLADLNGTYHLVVYDKSAGRLHLRADRYASRLLYYAHCGNHVFFAGDVRLLLNCPGIPNAINYDAVADFLSYEFIFRNETLYRAIHVFPHGQQLVWDGRQARWQRYWDYPQALPHDAAATADEYREQAAELLRRAVHRRAGGRRPCFVTLSAGMDSRAIACFLKEAGLGPFQCLHLGTKGAERTRWVQEICEALEVPLEIIEASQLDYPYLVSKAADLLGGQASLNQAEIFWLLASRERHDQSGYVLDGQLQDHLLKSLYIYFRDAEPSDFDHVYQILKGIYLPAHPNALKRVLKPEWHRRCLANQVERVRGHLEGRHFDDIQALTQYVYLTTRAQRYVWTATSLEFAVMDVGLPGMDYDLFDWAMALPVHLRAPDAALYRSIFTRHFPSVAGIPWDATGAPLSADRRRLRPSDTIWSAEFLLHLLRRASLGRIDRLSPAHDANRRFRTHAGYRKAYLQPVEAMVDSDANPLSKDGIKKYGRIVLHGRNYFQFYRRVVTLAEFFNRRHGQAVSET